LSLYHIIRIVIYTHTMDLDSSNTIPFWMASERSFTGDEGYHEASPKELLQFSDLCTPRVSLAYQ
jgi:hypothetical protein